MASVQRVLYELVGVDRASHAFRSAGASAGSAERMLGRLGRTAALAGGALAAGAVVAGAESVKMAVSFQASMEKIHTQAGAGQKSVDSLSKSVLKLGTYAEQSPQQLADALFHLKSLGMQNVQAMRALKTASDLAAVGGANLEQTATAVGAAWRSGIKGAQNFGAAAGALNAIIGAGNMRMQDLIDALGSGILPAARTFGVSLKSVGSALALLTDEGVPADSAANRLRMTLSLLGAPSKKAAGLLATIGLSATGLAATMRSPGGLVAAIAELKSHLDASGLSAVKQAQLLSGAFGGGRYSATIMTLVNNLSVLQRKQAQINATTGRYGGAVAAQRKTAQAQFALLKSSLDVLGVKIGSALLPPLVKFTAFLNSTVLPVAVTAGKAIGTAFGHLIPVKSIERDWDRLLVFLGLRKPPKVKLTAADLIHMPKPAAMTAADLIHPQALKGSVPWSVDLLHPAKTSSKTAASLASSLAAALGKVNWGKVLGRALGKLGSFATLLIADLGAALGRIDWVNVGKSFGGHAIGFAIGFINGLGNELFTASFWEHHWWDVIVAVLAFTGIGKVGGKLADVFAKIPVLKILAPLLRKLGKWTEPLQKMFGWVFRTAIDFVAPGLRAKLADLLLHAETWIGSHAIDFGRAGLKLLHGIGDGLTGARDWLYRRVASVIGWLTSPFRAAGRWLLAAGRDVISGLLSGVTGRWGAVARWLGGTAGRILAPLRGAGRWLLSTGGNLIGGLLGGIRAKMAGIAKWIQGNIVNPVVSWVKHWFGIKSPSTVMHGIGLNLVAGLLRGLATTDGEAVARTIFGSLPKALASIVSRGLVSVASLPGRAVKALGGLGGKILSFLGIGTGGGGGPAVAAGQRMAAAMGWTGANWQALKSLWMGESGWNPRALNQSSGAYGIPQSLPASKMASAGADWRTNPATQIRWGLAYIRSVYGSPLNAYRMWLSRSPHWYGHGGPFAAGQLIGVGDRGPELVSFSRPGRVLSPEQSAAALSGGEFTGNLYLDSGQFLGLVRGEITAGNRKVLRAARAGAGLAR